jgi:anaerobic selenocysteine-containing dehydrogenase
MCMGHCGVVVTVDQNNHLVDIRGDHEDSQTLGFACFKGLKATESHNSPNRILKPLKRMPNGTFEPIPLEQALDEIATKLKLTIDQHGSEAVGGYKGGGAFFTSASSMMLNSFLSSVGSHKAFSSVTIDQSSKAVALGRIGIWPAGRTPFRRGDIFMIFGGNPLVSIGTNGFDTRNPLKRLKEAKARGMKLIVVDPRETETAKFADIFMQPLPGEDCTILAGLIYIILAQSWQDQEFCDEHADNLDVLRSAVAGFTPEHVSKQAGVDIKTLVQVAELFAKDCSTGAATSATGPDMSAHANLAEHLIECLNIICGRFLREGDVIDHPGLLTPRYPRKAQVIPAPRWWEEGFQSRVGEFGVMDGELPSGIIANEILQPGPGQIKSFIVHGGNPISAVPDQHKIVEAFKALDLLVTIDPFMTVTAQLSDYILPPTMPYERPDLPLYIYETLVTPVPFTRYTDALSKPPEGAEVVDDNYYFWSLAKRLEIGLDHFGQPMDMMVAPVTEELLRKVVDASPLDFDELRATDRGIEWVEEPILVEAADPNVKTYFSLMPEDVAVELADVKSKWLEIDEINKSYPLRMSSRRLRDALNSACLDLPSIKKRAPVNYAYINSKTLADLVLEDGERVQVQSEHGAIELVTKMDETMRDGVVSVAHGFGALPDQQDYLRYGANTNLLISSDRNIEAINAMPRMSGIPIRILKIN